MDQQEIMALEAAHTSGVYPKRPLAIVRGQGARVWDADGNEYIDCVGGQGAANLGHAHPAIVAAISQQAAQLITCPEIFYNDRRAELLAALTAVAPAGMTRAFLCNSGAEAVEAAIKFARLSTGRIGIVAAMRGFHGRTMGALSATWNKDYREPFEPLVPGFVHVPYNDLAALDANVCDDTAAVILEVVQGEGGVHRADPAFLAGAQALCRERGALLILDEIQTGYGRTGKLFACQHDGIEPDLMTVAKSMAGGLPMGACLIGPRVRHAGADVPRQHLRRQPAGVRRGPGDAGGHAHGRSAWACCPAGRPPAGAAADAQLAADPRGARARVDRRDRSAGQGDAHPAEVAGARRPGPARRLDRPAPPAAAGHRGRGSGTGGCCDRDGAGSRRS